MKPERLDTIIFDVAYASSTLSSLLSTLDDSNCYQMCSCNSGIFNWRNDSH